MCSSDLLSQPRPSALAALSPHDLTTDHPIRVVDARFDVLVVHAGGALRTLAMHNFVPALEHTAEHHLAEAHLSLVDSFSLLATPLQSTLDVLSATAGQRTPKTVKEALSPAFLSEWGAAMDREISGFLISVLPSSLYPLVRDVYRVFGFFLASVMELPRLALWWVGIDKLRVKIILPIRPMQIGRAHV